MAKPKTTQTLLNKLSQEEIDKIVSMYENNISLREIERRTGHGRPAITKMLETLGVKTTFGNHYRYNFFNFDFFENIDNELSAYWLGFIYADGCVEKQNKYGEQTFKIAIHKKDQELLEKFKLDIESTYPIREDSSRGNEHIQVIQQLRSQKTVDDLKRLGCLEHKSLILKFPDTNQVPKHLLYHFVRGYFDGDGSISKYKRENTHKDSYNISFVGTENFIKGLYNFLNMGSVFQDKRAKNSWYLNINGNKQVIKLYHLLYDNANRYMQRKYLIFQELLKQDENPGN